MLDKSHVMEEAQNYDSVYATAKEVFQWVARSLGMGNTAVRQMHRTIREVQEE